MKKLKFVITVVLMGAFCVSNAQSMKDKLQAKLDAKSSKSKGKDAFSDFNSETDDMGITGSYNSLVDKKTYGFRFVKEEGGNIVNKLHYFEKKGTEPQLKMNLKESYFSKNQVKLFYAWINASAAGYVEIIEIAPNVYAQISSDRSYNDGPVALDAKRTVKDVYAKNIADLETWDIETAQAQVDIVVASLNTEQMEKDTKKWMENKVYAANVEKIVFADQHYHLMKQGYTNKPPMVTGDDFKTELDMGGNMHYMAFFKYPPSVKYPGQEINVVYEMNGKKSSRTEMRVKSAAWSKMIKRWETKDFDYRQHAPKALREYNSYHGQYVQDYAFINLLYLNKDNFKVGEVYELTVKMYSSRDGENGDLLAEGVVKLKYTEAADKAFNGDPKKPEIKGVWGHFTEFLDE